MREPMLSFFPCDTCVDEEVDEETWEATDEPQGTTAVHEFTALAAAAACVGSARAVVPIFGSEDTDAVSMGGTGAGWTEVGIESIDGEAVMGQRPEVIRA